MPASFVQKAARFHDGGGVGNTGMGGKVIESLMDLISSSTSSGSISESFDFSGLISGITSAISKGFDTANLDALSTTLRSVASTNENLSSKIETLTQALSSTFVHDFTSTKGIDVNITGTQSIADEFKKEVLNKTKLIIEQEIENLKGTGR
jgi:hypothetical protein